MIQGSSNRAARNDAACTCSGRRAPTSIGCANERVRSETNQNNVLKLLLSSLSYNTVLCKN